MSPIKRIRYPERAIIPANQILSHIKSTHKIRTSFMVVHEGIYKIYFFVKDLSAADETRLLFIHELGGQRFEESFKCRSYWAGRALIWHFQCRCSRWTRVFYIMDDGNLGCRKCIKKRPVEMEPEHRRMSMIPNALLAYMIAAKTYQKKSIALKLFQNYVRIMRGYIKRKPGRLGKVLRILKEDRKHF